MVGGVSRVNRDVPPYMMLVGESEIVGLNSIGLKRAGMSVEVRRQVRQAYKVIYHERLTVAEAAARLRESAKCDEVAQLAEFLATTERGICQHRASKRP